MEGFTRITKLVVALYRRAYGPTSVEGAETTYTVPPGKPGEGLTVLDGRAAELLRRLDHELVYVSQTYQRLDKERKP